MYKVLNYEYGGLKLQSIIKINEDGSTISFPNDENNPEYQAYLAWIDEGNTPEPADEV